MRQLEFDIVEILGRMHERPRHRLNLPDRSLDHCVALALADSTLFELHSDRTHIPPKLPDDLMFQCDDGPLTVGLVDEILETAEKDVLCCHLGRPLISSLVLNDVTRHPSILVEFVHEDRQTSVTHSVILNLFSHECVVGGNICDTFLLRLATKVCIGLSSACYA